MPVSITDPSPPTDSSAPQSTSSQAVTVSAGTKRTQEEPLTGTGRAKQQKQDALAIEARHVARTLDAFITPGAMFNFSLDNMVTSTSIEANHLENYDKRTPEELRYFRIYKHLCQRIPQFTDRILDANIHTFCEHEKLFKTGLSAARSDDIATLKPVVIDWLICYPYIASTPSHPLSCNSKTTRGFNNPTIGELLCPTELNWADPVIQKGLKEAMIDIHPSQWPTFLYEEGVIPAEGSDMWTGFLCHQLIVKLFQTLKHIYTSPSSVDGTDSSRATRSSKAALAGMTGMTVGAIVDVIVKLRHSLSWFTTFQKNDKASNNELFYYGLLEVLEAPQSQEQVHELLKWYDRQLFPGREAAKGPTPGSALARMHAQLGLPNAVASDED